VHNALRLRSTVRWYRRLGARVAVGLTLLIGLSLGSVLVATTRVVRSRSLSRASEELEVARSAFYRLVDARADSAAALTRLITELPVFRAHMSDARLADDPETIAHMADGYRHELNAQFVIVTDGHGAWLGSSGWTAGQRVPALRSSIDAAGRGAADRAILSVDDRLYLVVSEPVRFSEEVLGTMTVGFVLDDGVARELAEVTHCQVNLVSRSYISGSSLSGDERAALARMLSDGAAAPVNLSEIRVGGAEYIRGSFPLVHGADAAALDRLVLLKPWQPTQQFVDAIQTRILVAGGVVFVLAIAGGLLFSHYVDLPLRNVAAAAEEIAGGNWHHQVPVRGSAEATTMAVAFNEMTSSLRAAQERLLHDALHDHLTGLPNRALFMDRVSHARSHTARRPQTFAVLFVDLDRFKTVNDSLGHTVGDCLLLEIARRLREATAGNDAAPHVPGLDDRHGSDSTLARLGGDEFTVLLENIRDASDAVRIAERLLETIAAPVRLEGTDIFATASIGIAVSTSGHGGAEELVRDADTAMYRAKAMGGNRYAVFDATMHRGAVERLQLETALRRAIERDEFEVYYQPIVHLGDSRLTGFEALVRWNHPEQGFLSPAAFIPVAEDTGLIAHIDRWVLRAACQAAREWHTRFPHDSPLTVSVNISARSFAQPDLVRHVTHTLQETGLEPNCLRLEITEGAAMADAERARAVLMDLKALGVRLSLDDFGTGFSSLSYLQRFPVDTLKIDQSFIARIDQHDCREIIRTMLNLARTLRLDVVAEGTETSSQVDFLESLDCGFGQGYFFSRPIPADVVDGLLERLEDGYGSLVPRSTAVVPLTVPVN